MKTIFALMIAVPCFAGWHLDSASTRVNPGGKDYTVSFWCSENGNKKIVTEAHFAQLWMLPKYLTDMACAPVVNFKDTVIVIRKDTVNIAKVDTVRLAK